jgi:hypothetical protein
MGTRGGPRLRVRPRLVPLAGRSPRSAAGVAVYRHLPREVFSVRALDGPDKGRVLAHGTELGLRDARMVVNEGARRKIAAGGPKGVHAWITGSLATVILEDPVRITYRPHVRGVFFVAQTGQPVLQAAAVAFLGSDVFIDRADMAGEDVDIAVTEIAASGGTSQ